MTATKGDPPPRQYDLIAIGVSCVEEIIGVPTLPSLDSHREVEICGRWRSVGGNGLNVAVHAARLGAAVGGRWAAPDTVHRAPYFDQNKRARSSDSFAMPRVPASSCESCAAKR